MCAIAFSLPHFREWGGTVGSRNNVLSPEGLLMDKSAIFVAETVTPIGLYSVSMVRCKTMLVLLLALAYAGQAALASTSPCRIMPMDAGMVAHGGALPSAVPGGDHMAAHAGHHVADEGTADSAAGDCCDSGLCDMNQCHAPPALPSSMAIQAAHSAQAYAQPGRPSSPVNPSYSLFKPPIFL